MYCGQLGRIVIVAKTSRDIPFSFWEKGKIVKYGCKTKKTVA